MELWIRSQDKTKLIKAENIMITEDVIMGMTIVDVSKGETIQPPIKSEIMIIASDAFVGKYPTKERALEVLDEIQSKLKGTFLMKMRDAKYSKYIEDGKKYLENLNGTSIVTGDACFDIEPISKDIYVYEMPEE